MTVSDVSYGRTCYRSNEYMNAGVVIHLSTDSSVEMVPHNASTSPRAKAPYPAGLA